MISFKVSTLPDPLSDALSKGTLFSLNMDTMKAAKSDSIEWNLVQQFPFPDNYDPVMALAQNHIHFLDVGNDGPGIARIFVIHCELSFQSAGRSTHPYLVSYLQPETQSYSGSKTFPAVHGQTASFFKDSGVQQEFAFVPDDFSATYVINVENNSTQSLTPPTVKDTKSSYVASITSLVQLDSTGAVSFLPYASDNSSTNANVAWTSVKALAAIPKSSGGSSTSSSQKVTSTGTTGNNTSASGSSGGALSNYAVTSGLVGLAVLFAVLGFF